MTFYLIASHGPAKAAHWGGLMVENSRNSGKKRLFLCVLHQAYLRALFVGFHLIIPDDLLHCYKIETFRFILKFHTKIASRVLFACASTELLHQLCLWLGRVTSHGLMPPPGDLFCQECITLLLIQKLIRN